MRQKDTPVDERRKYIRLDSVFPVQFCLISKDAQQPLSEWLQGFTNNVGKGGICLTVNNLKSGLVDLLKEQKANLSLGIEMPLAKNPIKALAEASWIKAVSGAPDRFIIGVNYTQISPSENSRIMRYALLKKFFIPFVITVISILGLGLAINSIINIELIKNNKSLVEQLVRAVQDSNFSKQGIKEMAGEREGLQARIKGLEDRIRALEKERDSAKTQAQSEAAEKAEGIEELVRTLEKERESVKAQAQLETAEKLKSVEELNSMIEQLSTERAALQTQLSALQLKEHSAAEELLRLDEKRVVLEKANLDKMYKWLKVHQNPHSGLVMSFEGDGEIADWAFIYDQALVSQAYVHFGDLERARRIFDFFERQAKRQGKLFFNAYYCSDGNPAEYTVHSGPNIWVGISMLQYAKKTKDLSYVNLAEEIAQGVFKLQDKEGGIRGGPEVEWYATEHNLDAYAFFNMLHKITGKDIYRQAADRVLGWLAGHTYGGEELPIKRGKGDSTIATDTYTWSIAAIGPEKLKELDMDPDKILEFAEKNCAVEVAYARPDGKTLKVRGFDFAAQRNLSRGQVVSSEWTAQMVISFKIMSEFYRKKGMTLPADNYAAKAEGYLSELSKMIISSPSPSGQGESCLAYSTQDFVDTGHGWFTPKGKSTGSVAGTTYTLFAYYGYNPLELKE